MSFFVALCSFGGHAFAGVHLILNTSPGNRLGANYIRHRVAEAIREFFVPSVYHSDDPLVQLVNQNPTGAARFIRLVLGVAGLLTLASGCLCLSVLASQWEQCGTCSRPLRLWVVVYIVLNFLTLPARLLLLAIVLRAEEVEESFHESVACVTASPAWRFTKRLSVVAYVWFMIGAVWAMNSQGCPTCPIVFKMVVALILQSTIRAVASLVALKLLFPQVDDHPKDEPSGASEAQIEALPTITFGHDEIGRDDGCAVCLSEYEVGEKLLRLPCGHHFHCSCAAQWLHRNKRCPLCVQAIDSTVQRHPRLCKAG